jgi:hypothetical protein
VKKDRFHQARKSLMYDTDMSLVELKEQTKELSSDEFFEFARWIRELESAAWDREIALDLESGRFDDLLGEVQADIDAGKLLKR